MLCKWRRDDDTIRYEHFKGFKRNVYYFQFYYNFYISRFEFHLTVRVIFASFVLCLSTSLVFGESWSWSGSALLCCVMKSETVGNIFFILINLQFLEICQVIHVSTVDIEIGLWKIELKIFDLIRLLQTARDSPDFYFYVSVGYNQWAVRWMKSHEHFSCTA